VDTRILNSDSSAIGPAERLRAAADHTQHIQKFFFYTNGVISTHTWSTALKRLIAGAIKKPIAVASQQ